MYDFYLILLERVYNFNENRESLNKTFQFVVKHNYISLIVIFLEFGFRIDEIESYQELIINKCCEKGYLEELTKIN